MHMRLTLSLLLIAGSQLVVSQTGTDETGSGDSGPPVALCQLTGKNADPENPCGSAEGQCLQVGDKVTRKETIKLCVGFQPHDSHEVLDAGVKAVFETKVDEYASMSVLSLAQPIASETFSVKAPYSYVWVGTRDKRTIGQQKGLATADGSTCMGGVAEDGVAEGVNISDTPTICYGWRLHNKPLVTQDGQLIDGLTALIHVDLGVITHIMWDSNCNLCGGRSGTTSCLPDGSPIVCASKWLGGSAVECKDCYTNIADKIKDGEGSAPKIYFAWLGTDKHGASMLSAGRVISRFAVGSLQGVTDAFADKISELCEGECFTDAPETSVPSAPSPPAPPPDMPPP